MLDGLKAPAHLATAGCPDHPHRGFETCSIMIEGKMEHQDFVGNKVCSQTLTCVSMRNDLEASERQMALTPCCCSRFSSALVTMHMVA